MNRPADHPAADDTGHAGHTANADLRLQQVLRELPTPLDAARLDALQTRVLAQWQAAEHTAAAAHTHAGARGRTLSLLAAPRRGWVLASGLVIGVSLATVFWLQRPDPVMDDLLQPDVLSQMAIGEM